jgi:SAM-dependent methyltransferase
LLLSPNLTESEKALVSRISLDIHPNDGMYEAPGALHYLSVGISARRCIQIAIQHMGKPSIHRVLNFACGYGRELRVFKDTWPEASYVVADIDKDALRFCNRHFGATAIHSGRPFASIEAPGKFDLIWCGSLVTHLAKEDSADLLAYFCKNLVPGGLCLFSTHGNLAAQWIKEGKITYGMPLSASWFGTMRGMMPTQVIRTARARTGSNRILQAGAIKA